MFCKCEGVHNPWWGIPPGGDYYLLEQNINGESEERPQGGYNLVDTDIFRLGKLPRTWPKV